MTEWIKQNSPSFGRMVNRQIKSLQKSGFYEAELLLIRCRNCPKDIHLLSQYLSGILSPTFWAEMTFFILTNIIIIVHNEK